MHINQLIGRRLAEEIGRGHSADFRRDMEPYVGREWDKATYYDATAGRRVFRIAELVGLARALGVPVYKLVDGRGAGIDKVTIAVGAEPIGVEELVDLFKAPGEAQGPMWRSLLYVREILGELPALLVAARKAEKELKVFFPPLPALEEDEKP
jgi:hypothetical protein